VWVNTLFSSFLYKAFSQSSFNTNWLDLRRIFGGSAEEDAGVGAVGGSMLMSEPVLDADRVVRPDDDPKNISLAAPFKAFMYLLILRNSDSTYGGS
jgi:hypothetical protein